MRMLIWAFAAMLLIGCSQAEYVHPYKTKEQFLNDYNRCDRAVTDYGSTALIPQNAYAQNQMIENCLRKDYGWVKKPD